MTSSSPPFLSFPLIHLSPTPPPPPRRIIKVSAPEVDIDRVKKIVLASVVDAPSENDAAYIWEHRNELVSEPWALPAVIKSTSWDDRQAAEEMHRLLLVWKAPSPLQALQLLAADFADPKVRAFAVAQLEHMSDERLEIYLLQLCQVLKYEMFHDSALARFLLRRAVMNTERIGHALFWYLRAELHQPGVTQRFGILIQCYMRNCGSAARRNLGQQLFLMRELQAIQSEIKGMAAATKKAKVTALRSFLEELRHILPKVFQLPLGAKYKCSDIIVD